MTAATPSGILVLDKPAGVTSRDVVDRAETWFPKRTRLGHAGTLDPLATGVLVICVGQATRLVEHIQDMGKVYEAGLVLGARSDTDDADGQLTEVTRTIPAENAIRDSLAGFVGEIAQVPPAYSAAKVAGRRAHQLARKGRAVDLAPKLVRIDSVEILKVDPPRLSLRIHCGKGTYIRSLARDLGERLGCGAYVETLRRTRVGVFEAASALNWDASEEDARARMLPIAMATSEMKRVTLGNNALMDLVWGKRVPWPDGQGGELAVLTESGELIAIVAVEAGRLRPRKVFKGPEWRP